MNRYDDITPQLRAWLREPVSLREDGVGRVSQSIHRSPQQRGLLPPLAGPLPGGSWSAVGVVVASMIVVLIAGILLSGVLREPSVDVAPAAAPPNWQGVEFTPVEGSCPNGCDWDTGGIWRVSAAHRGDFGSTEAIAFGPSGAPWFLSDDSVWQLGVPGGSNVSPMATTHDLEVASDGVVWVASDFGLHSYDGRDWTSHWTEMPLNDVHLALDGTVYAIGGGRGQHPVTVVSHDGVGVTSVPVDAIDPDRWPTSVAVDGDGRVWVSAIASGYVPSAEGESLIAYTDGAEWHPARPLGADTDVAAFSLVRAPDGSVWSLLWALTPEEGIWKRLARFDGQDWTVRAIEHDPVGVVAIGPDGTAWFLGDGEVRAFDGSSWARYRAFQQPGALAIGPDGTVLVATVPGFDEEGELLAIRHAPPPHP